MGSWALWGLFWNDSLFRSTPSLFFIYPYRSEINYSYKPIQRAIGYALFKIYFILFAWNTIHIWDLAETITTQVYTSLMIMMVQKRQRASEHICELLTRRQIQSSSQNLLIFFFWNKNASRVSLILIAPFDHSISTDLLAWLDCSWFLLFFSSFISEI